MITECVPFIKTRRVSEGEVRGPKTFAPRYPAPTASPAPAPASAAGSGVASRRPPDCYSELVSSFLDRESQLGGFVSFDRGSMPRSAQSDTSRFGRTSTRCSPATAPLPSSKVVSSNVPSAWIAPLALNGSSPGLSGTDSHRTEPPVDSGVPSEKKTLPVTG